MRIRPDFVRSCHVQNLPHAYLAQTKIVATLGNESRTTGKIEELLNAGMSGKTDKALANICNIQSDNGLLVAELYQSVHRPRCSVRPSRNASTWSL